MLTEWTICNFKSVQSETPLTLAPLTIFAGSNSSGKSTIIQSILLTAQTIQNSVISRPIILNGHIVKLGAYNDIATISNDASPISIGFSIKPPIQRSRRHRTLFLSRWGVDVENITKICCAYSFLAESEKKSPSQLQPWITRSQIRTCYLVDEKEVCEEVTLEREEGRTESVINRFPDFVDALKAAPTSALEYSPSFKPPLNTRMKSIYDLPLSADAVGGTFRHFLPDRVTFAFDVHGEAIEELVSLLTRPENSYFRLSNLDPKTEGSFRVVISTFIIEYLATRPKIERFRRFDIPDILEWLKSNDRTLSDFASLFSNLPATERRAWRTYFLEKEAEFRTALKSAVPPNVQVSNFTLFGYHSESANYINSYFSRLVRYLGPLRDEPKAVYPLAGTPDPKDVGFKGEYTAAVLDIYKDTKITYVPSQVFSQSNDSPQAISRKDHVETTLLAAVVDWLRHMGVVYALETEDLGKLGHQLRVYSSSFDKTPQDLTHVGVGVSQVLPILVLSLLAEEGSILIFEQPELHLHPRVQSRLADFFISMTMLNKQCIVETHSEYMINRLRYTAASAEGDEFSKRVIIYFAEKKETGSSYTPLKINRFGKIDNWPKGFFDEKEETAAAIVIAAMAKKQQEMRPQ